MSIRSYRCVALDEPDRRVGVAPAVDPTEYALVNFRERYLDSFPAVITKVGHLSRTVAIIASEPRAGIVKSTILVLGRFDPFRGVGVAFRLGLECQAMLLGLIEHRVERYECKCVVGIATSDIGVHSWEPNLDETFFFRARRNRPGVCIGASGSLSACRHFGPEYRMKSRSLVIQADGVPRKVDVITQHAIR